MAGAFKMGDRVWIKAGRGAREVTIDSIVTFDSLVRVKDYYGAFFIERSDVIGVAESDQVDH